MSEEDYYKRVTLSLQDVDQCMKYIQKCLECRDDVIKRALHESIIISYVRPFSGYNKRFHKISDLKKEFKKKFDNEELRVHEKICKSRNELIAHSDNKVYGVSFSVSKLSESFALAIPIMSRIPWLLEEHEVEILKSCCLKLETYLFNEQERIRTLLKPGYYS